MTVMDKSHYVKLVLLVILVLFLEVGVPFIVVYG